MASDMELKNTLQLNKYTETKNLIREYFESGSESGPGPKYGREIYGYVIMHCQLPVSRKEFYAILRQMILDGEFFVWSGDKYATVEERISLVEVVRALCINFDDALTACNKDYCNIKQYKLSDQEKEDYIKFRTILDSMKDNIQDSLQDIFPLWDHVIKNRDKDRAALINGIPARLAVEIRTRNLLNDQTQVVKATDTLQRAEAARLAQLASLYKNKNTAGLTDKADTPA